MKITIFVLFFSQLSCQKEEIVCPLVASVRSLFLSWCPFPSQPYKYAYACVCVRLCPFSWQVLFLINARSTYSPSTETSNWNSNSNRDSESWKSFL